MMMTQGAQWYRNKFSHSDRGKKCKVKIVAMDGSFWSSEGNLLQASFLTSGISQYVLCSLVCFWVTLVCLHYHTVVSLYATYMFPRYNMALAFGIYVYPNIAWLPLNLIIPAMNLFQNKFKSTCIESKDFCIFSYSVPTTESYLVIFKQLSTQDLEKLCWSWLRSFLPIVWLSHHQKVLCMHLGEKAINPNPWLWIQWATMEWEDMPMGTRVARSYRANQPLPDGSRPIP